MKEQISIIPYRQVDGIWTFKDSYICSLYEQMEHDGTDKTVFINGSVQDRHDFLQMMKRNISYVVLLDKDPNIIASCAWLTRLQHNWAQFNFTFFSDFWGRNTSIPIGKYVLKQLIHLTDNRGQYVFDAFLGITPTRLSLACRYAYKMNFQKIGIMPNGIWNDREEQSEEALFTYFTRECCDENI